MPVNAVAHGADVAMPGLQVQMIGKSGSNLYHGSFSGTTKTGVSRASTSTPSRSRKASLPAVGLTPRDTNRLSHFYDVDAGVGGYLKKDRVWWYGSTRLGEVAT